MNHPAPEEWVPYLFGDAPAAARRQLKQHLHSCAECRRQLQTWQNSLGGLDAWRLPASVRSVRAGEGFGLLKWAAVGVVILAAGLGVGFSMAANTSAERVRARLEPQLRHQLRQEFAGLLRQELAKSAAATLAAAREESRGIMRDSVATLETQRLEENQAIYTALDRLFLSLKKDVDTVAVYTDESLRRLAQASSGELPSDSPQP